MVHYHHPAMTSDCPDNGTLSLCHINHVSITENVYHKLDEHSLDKTPIAAYEMRTKMKSSQSIHVAAGEVDAEFEALDGGVTTCQKDLQNALDWATQFADKDVMKQYLAQGQELVMGEDINMTNGGLWIIEKIKIDQPKDKQSVTYHSQALPLDGNHFIGIFNNMHYCKLVSPLHALEWIYVDSQYA